MLLRTVAPTHLQRLRVHLEAYAGGPLPDFDLFARNVTEVVVPARRVLIRAGDHHPYVYLVTHGLLKTVHEPPGEAPRILFFTDENDFAASLSALGMTGLHALHEKGMEYPHGLFARAARGEARSSLIAVETSSTLRADFQLLEQLAERHARWAQLIITFLASHSVKLTSCLYSVRCEDAERRFHRLLADNPTLPGRVTQRDLASYLGVSEAAMSRIIGRVRATGNPGDKGAEAG